MSEERKPSRFEKEHARMFIVLKRITYYQSPQQLRRSSQKQFGLGADEAIEMAYENVLAEAKNGLKGVRTPPGLKIEGRK